MPFTIVSDKCEGIGDCRPVCPEECISVVEDRRNALGVRYSVIDPARCTDCGACRSVCPIPDAILAEWRPDLQHTIPVSRPRAARQGHATGGLRFDLEEAVASGDVDRLRDRLARTDVDAVLEAAPRLLHFAAAVGEPEHCRLLLDFGYSVHVTNAAGQTPLLAAVSRHDLRPQGGTIGGRSERSRRRDILEISRLLLRSGANPDVQDPGCWTSLHHAAAAAHDALLWLLIDWGARIDGRDRTSRTALHLAAERSAPASIAALLAAGSDPAARDLDGATPLDRAMHCEFVHGAAALMFASRSMDVRVTPLALHALAFAGDLDRLARAIAKDPNLDALDPRGRTAMHWAAQAGRAGSVMLLMDAGARPDILDATGASVADYGLSAHLSESQRDAFAAAFRIDPR